DTGHVRARLVERRDALEALLEQILDVTEHRRDTALRQLEHDLLGAVDELHGLAGPFPPELCDALPGVDQAAERRHLAHDARVMRRVRRGGNERGELVQAPASADILQLAS